MLVLSITRDGTFCGQVPVAGGLRLGRDPDNDVVLEDSSRGVSRFHAELSDLGGGVFLLTDLQSSNGTWVDGGRVQSVELSSDTPFSIGPYELVLEMADEVGAVDGVGHAAGAAAPSPDPQPQPSVAPRPEPPPPTAGPKGLLTNPRVVLGGGGALLLAGVLAGSLLGGGSPGGGAVDAGLQRLLDDARIAADGGDVGTALDLVDQALALDPGNREAAALRDRLDPPEPPPPPGPAAEAAPAAAPPVEPAGPAAGVRPTTARPPTLTMVEVSGIRKASNESAAVYGERVRRAQASLTEAGALLRASRFAEAGKIATELASAHPEFHEARDLAARIQAEHTRALEQARGRAAVARQRGDLVDEATGLAEVQRLDPQADVAARQSELAAMMAAAGEKAFTEGTLYENSERFDLARAAYERAIRLLPDGHPRRVLAAQYLKQLGG